MSLSILIFVPSKNLKEAQGLGFDHVLILDKESFSSERESEGFLARDRSQTLDTGTAKDRRGRCAFLTDFTLSV